MYKQCCRALHCLGHWPGFCHHPSTNGSVDRSIICGYLGGVVKILDLNPMAFTTSGRYSFDSMRVFSFLDLHRFLRVQHQTRQTQSYTPLPPNNPTKARFTYPSYYIHGSDSLQLFRDCEQHAFHTGNPVLATVHYHTSRGLRHHITRFRPLLIVRYTSTVLVYHKARKNRSKNKN